jgi:hypothetical protein
MLTDAVDSGMIAGTAAIIANKRGGSCFAAPVLETRGELNLIICLGAFHMLGVA